VLAREGIPIIAQLVDRALRNPSAREWDAVLSILGELARYPTRQATDVVVRAVRHPVRPASTMWRHILGAYTKDHPESARLFKELSDPLPAGPLAALLLACGNAASCSGASGPHPFDSPAGVKQLEAWLTDGEDHAVSAAFALNFIEDRRRDALLAIALDHPCGEVQVEAAWTAARLGRAAGVEWLARMCLEVNYSGRAQNCLKHLRREEMIPVQSKEVRFRVKADFAAWLAQTHHVGRPPDELEIIDHRELAWPPDRKHMPLWLLKYRSKDRTGLMDDDVGVGLMKNKPSGLFFFDMHERPIEDVYAIHCYAEMENRGLIAEDCVENTQAEYRFMLERCPVEGLAAVNIIYLAEMSPDLKYPRRLVALAEATREGEPGWIVLDGPASRWYAVSEMPASVDQQALMVHVGRVLLGFGDEPDRRKFLQPARPMHSPEEVVANYERLLDRARLDTAGAQEHFGGGGLLARAFSNYVSALAAVRSESQEACTCRAYESILSAATSVEASQHGEVLGFHSIFGGGDFYQYVNSLIALNRQADIPPVIETLRPHWEHTRGYCALGRAAFTGEHDGIAEPLLTKVRHGEKHWWIHDEMEMLAEIWHRQGLAEGHTLLIDALKAIVAMSSTLDIDELDDLPDIFQMRRSAYLRIFADGGEDELRRQGIPDSIVSTLENWP
jgi:hypothetical protein